MGLWGKETEWQTEARLAEIPQEELQGNAFERAAIERSLDLAGQRQRIIAAGDQLGLSRRYCLDRGISMAVRAGSAATDPGRSGRCSNFRSRYSIRARRGSDAPPRN